MPDEWAYDYEVHIHYIYAIIGKQKNASLQLQAARRHLTIEKNHSREREATGLPVSDLFTEGDTCFF